MLPENQFKKDVEQNKIIHVVTRFPTHNIAQMNTYNVENTLQNVDEDINISSHAIEYVEATQFYT